MIDFSKKIKSSNKFRSPALHYLQYGAYTLAPKGTREYLEYWDEESKRCKYGWTADDGDWISGYHYFYLNYCPILRMVLREVPMKNGVMKTVRVKEKEFPDFYDYDYYYFCAIQEAEEEGKHLIVLKARGRGYSFKGASMLDRNFYLFPDSKSYAIASEKEYLIKDGLLTKAWDLMDFIDENTAWTKKRQKTNTGMHRRASFESTDERGNKREDGYKSEIIGITLKNDPNRARGKRGKLILWEEAGSFRDILQAWQIARPSVEEDGVAFGLQIAFGTGGDESSAFDGLKEMFYNPAGYNIKSFPNIWDEHAENTECGFFVPTYVNVSILDEDGNRLYMDKDGNSLKERSIELAHRNRQEVIDGAKDSRAIDRYIAENPITPMDACLEITGNIFPKKDLQQQLSAIRTNKKLQSHKQVGDLLWENGQLMWHIKKSGDITGYPLSKDKDPEGSIVIWEHPVKDAPHGLYIGGCLTPGEQVLTNTGLMNVEDIDETNRLIDKEGKETSIEALLRYDKEDEDIYTLKLSNTYRTTTFTKEHPIYSSKHYLNKQNEVKENLFNFDFNKVSELKVGDWVKYPNVYLNNPPTTIEDYTTEGHEDYEYTYWWFIGLWLGDGWCSKNRVYICFDKTNEKQIERFKHFIKHNYNKELSIRERNGSVECSFTNSDLVDDLTRTYGKTAHYKFIPECIKHEENWIKQSILLGFLDSDGCIYNDKRGYVSSEFVSVNLKLLEDFQDIAFSLGIVGNLSKLRDDGEYCISGRTGKQKRAYHLRFGHNDSIAFADMCQFDDRSKLSKININTIKITRSRPKTGCFISEDMQYIYFQIKNIEKDKYTGVVYNFETSTHSFCTHHIPTHNCDPYDHDQSGTNSLGSTLIYKRFQNFESYYDVLVAEYTGRPKTAEEYYENVRKLLTYYNAKVLYENERKGIFPYFTAKYCDYLLVDQPDIISDIIGKSSVNRRKGIHMTKDIKEYGIGLIKEWLNTEFAPGEKNLSRILSEPLLEELISYNDKGNFDRVIALCMVMIYRLQLYNVTIKEKKEENKTQSLFSTAIFSSDWFNKEDNTSSKNKLGL